MRKFFSRVLFLLFRIPFFRKRYYGIMLHVVNKYNLLTKVQSLGTYDNTIKVKLDLSDWIQQQIYFLRIYDSEKEATRFWKNLIQLRHIIIDGGANIGYYSLMASKIVGNTGEVYAFEPVSKNFNRLKENIELNNFTNIQIFKKALSDVNDIDVEIYVGDEKNWGMSSIYKHERFSSQMEIVKTITIDSFLQQNQVNKVDVIKLDIEGSELFAIRGMKKCLETHKPIVLTEVNQEILNANGDKVSSIYDIFQEFNYFPYKVKDGLTIQRINKPIADNLVVFIPQNLKLENVEILN